MFIPEDAGHVTTVLWTGSKMRSFCAWFQDRQESTEKAWDVSKGSFPLIFAGGPTATSNPEPFADFFDFFALGDGEEFQLQFSKWYLNPVCQLVSRCILFWSWR